MDIEKKYLENTELHIDNSPIDSFNIRIPVLLSLS